MGQIKETENKLFEKWRESIELDKRECFIMDGVANEIEWNDSKYNIIFFLKEVNGGRAWDERDYLDKYNLGDGPYLKSHSPTITALSQLAYGILTEDREQEKWTDVYEKVHDGSEEQTKILKQIAIVNVKKISGSGIANYDKIDKFFKMGNNRDFLKKQIDIYCSNLSKKTIIISGNITSYYEMLYVDLRWKITTKGIRYAVSNNRIVIDFCHPQARIAACIKYYALIDAVKEILGNM